MKSRRVRRLLTVNCHEAWVHQLGYLGMELDIIDGMPGRYTREWDTHVRPVPSGARLMSLADALRERRKYHCIIGHNISDLLDLKTLPGPRLLVVHMTLGAKAGEEEVPPGFPDRVRGYLDKMRGHCVAVSLLKGRTWGFTDDVVPFAVDADAYPPWRGDIASGIRVGNQFAAKAKVLLWDFHQEAFRDVPVQLVGHNPEIPGVTSSQSWDHLKSLLAGHRFYVHTAHPDLEDGYNMATLEAMAAGLPILSNRHPSSPIEHGVDGFLSDDPAELGRYARTLIEDRALAGRMGEAARKNVRARFPMQRFVDEFTRSIDTARQRFDPSM
jgi:glycosyltransferase involved in cell wall biosynthesis